MLLSGKYNYKNLGISYHYYKPLLDLIERDTDVKIEDRYELQVFPYINGKSIKVDKAQISGNGTQPIYGYDSEKGRNVIVFYGLEYGKQYELKIESGNFVATKTFTYQKGDKIFDDLEIAYMDITLEEKAPVEDKPVEDKPVEDKPVEGKPVEDKPVEDKPVEDKPVEDKPVEDKPVEDKPVEDKPVENKPVEDKPVEDKPVEDKPVESKPSDGKDDDDIQLPQILPQTGENYFIPILLIPIFGIIFGVILYKIIKSRK